MAIDRNNPTPLYYQLELELLSKIRESEWKSGDPIPTESEICETYRLSRTTVRQALTNLVHQGFIVRQAGKGSFVREKKVHANMQRGFVRGSMQAAGLAPRRQVLDLRVEVGDPLILEELALPDDAELLRVRRLLFGGERPVALTDILMPRALVPSLTVADFEELDTYEVLARQGLRLTSGSVTLEARPAREDEVILLDIPSEFPVLATRRLAHLEDGRPFEILSTVSRSDMVVFTAHFQNIDDAYTDLADIHSRPPSVVAR